MHNEFSEEANIFDQLGFYFCGKKLQQLLKRNKTEMLSRLGDICGM